LFVVFAVFAILVGSVVLAIGVVVGGGGAGGVVFAITV
jgi:hypothetical protein